MSVELRLGSVLDIHAAEPLRVQLLALRGQSVVVDGSGVERLGGLCLQVLMSAQKTWASDGHSLVIEGVSRDFADQWNAFGAADLAHPQGEAA